MNSTLKKMIYLNATDKKSNETLSDYSTSYSESQIQLDRKFDYFLNKLPEIR